MTSPILHQLGVIAIASLVMFYPGALLAGLLGVRRALPAALQPAVAVSFTLTIVGLVLLPALYLQLAAETVLAVLGVVTVLLALWGMSRARKAADRAAAQPGAAPAPRVPGLRWLYENSPVAWLADLQRPLLALAALTGVIAFILGGWLDDGDMMYHTAIARKLAELDAPTFARIQLFVDGSLHPGYVAPPLHEVVALTAVISGADVATVMWVMAVPCAITAMLTIAGLAFVLMRSHAAALVGGVLFVVVDSLGRPPLYGAIPASVSPSAFSTHVLLPLALAAWVVALWHPQGPVRRASLATLLLGAMPALLLVHASYVAFLGIMVAGYFVVWALRAPWPREIIVRHLVAGVLLVGVTLAGLAAMAPALRKLVTFDPELKAAALQGEFAEYSRILVGSPASYHLRPDLLAWFGGLVLVGIACVLFGYRYLREPVGWLVVGATSAVLIVSQYDPLFMAFSEVASTHQSKRIAYALPSGIALTLGILAVGAFAARQCCAGRRVVGWGLTLLAGAGLGYAAQAWGPLPSIKSPPELPTWPIRALLYVVLVGAASLAIDLVLRFRRRRSATAALGALPEPTSVPTAATAPGGVDDGPAAAAAADPLQLRAEAIVGDGEPTPRPRKPLRLRVPYALPQLARPVVEPVPGAGWAVTIIVVLGTLPIVAPATRAVAKEAADRPTSALRAYDLARLDPEVIAGLREQPNGSIVMSPLKAGLRLEAVAPVYVVGVRLTHVARTKRNRAGERRDAVNRFYAADSAELTRLGVLDRERAQLVLVPRAATDVMEFIENHETSFSAVGEGKHQVLYRYTKADLL